MRCRFRVITERRTHADVASRLAVTIVGMTRRRLMVTTGTLGVACDLTASDVELKFFAIATALRSWLLFRGLV